MLEFLSSDPRFIELEQKIVSTITNAVTTAKAVEVYREMQSLISDWTFIFASSSGVTPGLAVNKMFSCGTAVVSPFSSDKVWILDSKTLYEMDYNGQAKLKIDYSIALDTQAMSYLVPFLGAGSDKLPKDMGEVFAFLAQDNVFVDPMPYVIENLEKINSDEGRQKIINNIAAYEKFRNMDTGHFNLHGVVQARLTDLELQQSAETFVNGIYKTPDFADHVGTVEHRQKIMFVILLKTVAIQLIHPSWPHYKKVSSLLDFMNDRLNCIFQREVITASKYFLYGQKFRFFSRIQRNKPLLEILSELSTMSWDYWHIRHIEESMSLRPDISGGYFFTALLTFDKRYIELLTSCPLQAYATKPGKGFPHPVYTDLMFGEGTTSFEAELHARYFNESALKNRMANIGNTWLKKELPGLETELIKVLTTICKS